MLSTLLCLAQGSQAPSLSLLVPPESLGRVAAHVTAVTHFTAVAGITTGTRIACVPAAPGASGSLHQGRGQ